MSNRRTPTTSRLAHESIKPAKAEMYVKIIAGLEKLKMGGTFYEIATYAGLKPSQVWKRTSELRDRETIFDTGITRPGESGRQCTVWQLKALKPLPKPITLTSKIKQTDLFSNI